MKMTRINATLEFLKTLILATSDDTFQINRFSLSKIQTCLKYAQAQIDFLQLESQLQQEELQQWSHHSKPVYVQKIETDSHKKQDNNVTFHSNLVPNEATVVHADVEVQFALPNPIIRSWEGIFHNRHKNGLGYDKDMSFHIIDYSMPIQFQSARFLQDSSPSAVLDSTPLPQQ